MLNWAADAILGIVKSVPPWFVTEDSPRFMLIRGMFALILVVFIVYVIATWPLRSAVTRCIRKMSNLIVRKP
jgi:hypothetical protein